MADISQEVKDIFELANPKRRFDQFGHLRWQILIRDTCLLIYRVSLDPNINNTIPLNHNVLEENAQTNEIDKSNSNINIQDNNSRVETGRQRDESNKSNNSIVINCKKK